MALALRGNAQEDGEKVSSPPTHAAMLVKCVEHVGADHRCSLIGTWAIISWVTQMQFMEDHPEYKFVASQAQQYEWLKQVHHGCRSDHQLGSAQLNSMNAWSRFLAFLLHRTTHRCTSA